MSQEQLHAAPTLITEVMVANGRPSPARYAELTSVNVANAEDYIARLATKNGSSVADTKKNMIQTLVMRRSTGEFSGWVNLYFKK